MKRSLLFPLLISLLLAACGGGGDEQDSAVEIKGPFGVGGVQLPPGGRPTIPEIKPNPIYFTNVAFEDGCARPGDFEENRISFRIGDRGDGPDGRRAYYPLIARVSVRAVSFSGELAPFQSFLPEPTASTGGLQLQREIQQAVTFARPHDATRATIVAYDERGRVLGNTQFPLPTPPTLPSRIRVVSGAQWVQSTVPNNSGPRNVWSLEVIVQNVALSTYTISSSRSPQNRNSMPVFYRGNERIGTEIAGPEQRVRVTFSRYDNERPIYGISLGIRARSAGWQPCARNRNNDDGQTVFADVIDQPVSTPPPPPPWTGEIAGIDCNCSDLTATNATVPIQACIDTSAPAAYLLNAGRYYCEVPVEDSLNARSPYNTQCQFSRFNGQNGGSCTRSNWPLGFFQFTGPVQLK